MRDSALHDFPIDPARPTVFGSLIVLVRRLGLLACSFLLLISCGDEGAGDEGLAGQLGQPCIGGSFCNEGLVCSAGVCMGEANDEADDADTGDGDGDSSSDGDGDGDTTTTTSTTTGGNTFPLYEGPCASSDECEDGGWCTESWGFCSMTCVDDSDCPPHPTATATPECTGLFSEVGRGAKLGCALRCEDASECHGETQCWTVGVVEWCAY